jgi:hypothetical protein
VEERLEDHERAFVDVVDGLSGRLQILSQSWTTEDVVLRRSSAGLGLSLAVQRHAIEASGYLLARIVKDP